MITKSTATNIGHSPTGQPNPGYLKYDAIRRQNMQNMTLLSIVGSLTQPYPATNPVGNFDIASSQRVVVHTGGTITAGNIIFNSPEFPSIRITSGADGAVNLQMTTVSKWVTGEQTPAMSANSIILRGPDSHDFVVTNGLQPHEGHGEVNAAA